jgi:acyl-CoA synthetase (AMP-forming)/AMP-acid ligase II
LVIPTEESSDSTQAVKAAASLTMPIFRTSQYEPGSGILPLVAVEQGTQFGELFITSRGGCPINSSSSSRFLSRKYSTSFDEGKSKFFKSKFDSIAFEENCDMDDFDGPDPIDVAILLHTSGTTSKPKLVPITHKSISIAMNAFCTVSFMV